MEIRTIPITKINPAPYNPRKDLQPGDPEYEKLKRSLEEFDLVEPLIWNEETGNLVGGHQRLKIIQERGDKEVAVSVVHLDEGKEKALNIALNKISGDWDYQKLDELLSSMADEDVALTGFDDAEIQKIVKQFEAEAVQDIEPSAPEIPITRPGELWQLGRHRLLCGDSTKAADVKRLFAGDKADCLITDPPYGVNYGEKNVFLTKFDKMNRIETPIINDDIKDYRKFFTSFLKLVPFADYNTFYIFMSGQHLHDLRLAVDDAGLTWGDYLIWVKNQSVFGRKDYHAKHEFVAYGWKQMVEVEGWQGRHRKYKPANDFVVYGWKNHHKFYGGYPNTLLEFDRPQVNDLHPTQKPVPLIGRLITDGTHKGAIIYDAFAGSGTTLVAAEQLDRTCYAIETDPHYCDVIIQRWETLTGKKAVRL